jgi:hypothetical protein
MTSLSLDAHWFSWKKKIRSSQFKGEKEENAGDQSGILWEMGNIGKEEILEK